MSEVQAQCEKRDHVEYTDPIILQPRTSNLTDYVQRDCRNGPRFYRSQNMYEASMLLSPSVLNHKNCRPSGASCLAPSFQHWVPAAATSMIPCIRGPVMGAAYLVTKNRIGT